MSFRSALGERTVAKWVQKQGGLARAAHQMIHQVSEGIVPGRPLHPRGDQSPARNQRYLRPLPADKTQHAKGAQGLTQIIQGKSYNPRLFLFKKRFQTSFKIRVKGIVFRMAGGPQKIGASER